MAFGYPPLIVTVGGQKLTGYTTFSLSRQKKDLTGSCELSLFYGYTPDRPVFAAAVAGAEIAVYVGGEIAFRGTVDKRSGSGGKQGRDAMGRFTSSKSTANLTVNKDTYEVTITARGKSKALLNSSHQHKTTNMKSPTTRDAVETLVGPFGVQVDWQGDVIKLDRLRFRDGANVFDELLRIGSEHCYYIYETREGKLRITDKPGKEMGEDIILGENILSFTGTQSEVMSNSEIVVKGQRTEKSTWGEAAILPTIVRVKDSTIKTYSPKTVQHFGDATEQLLQRRARFEASKRTEASKEVKVEIFHIQPRSGRPWELGTLHYVEIPPEGVFDVMECTGIDLHASESKLTTTLTLSPLPSGGIGGAGGGGLQSFAPSVTSKLLHAASRRAAAGATLVAGTYPLSWGGAQLVALAIDAAAAVTVAARGLSAVESRPLPDTLPASYKVKG